MATRKRQVVEERLVQKGFTLVPSKDHRYYVFVFENRTVARTKVSLGTKYKDLSDDLISAMARQCHLPKSEFLDLVDCPMTQRGYEERLREQGMLE